MSMFYDMDGNPISVEEFSEVYKEDRTIGKDMVGDLLVSTVYIGTKYNMFETMVFTPDFYEVSQFTRHYPTRGYAERGHKLIVQEVKELVENEEE